jgi:hypothetical protein
MTLQTTAQSQVASRLANEAVAKAVGQWKNRLLQLDRRNALLYFNAARRGVGLAEIAPDELVMKLSEARSGLSFPYAEKMHPGSV